MKWLFVITSIFFSTLLFGQDKTDLDLLSSPFSPAAGVVGNFSKDIHSITAFTQFSALLRQSTNDFNGLPTNFAFEIHPFTLKNNTSLSEEIAPRYSGQDVLKSVGFSFAASDKNTDFLATGLGLKVTLARGKLIEESEKRITTFVALNNQFDNLRLGEEYMRFQQEEQMTSLEENIRATTAQFGQARMAVLTFENQESNQLTALEQERDALEQNLNTLKQERDELRGSYLTKLQALQEFRDIEASFKNVNIERAGFKLDVSAGLRTEYPDSTFQSRETTKAALWLTANYDIPKLFDIAAITRFQHNPSLQYKDINAVLKEDNTNFFDAGLRIGVSPKKLKAGFEGIYRNVLNNDEIDSSLKWSFNASYDVGKNMIIDFTYGRDFDNVPIKDGNVIAAFEFIKGFGSKRELN